MTKSSDVEAERVPVENLRERVATLDEGSVPLHGDSITGAVGEVVRTLFARVLQEVGHTAIQADTSEAALDILRRSGQGELPDIDRGADC